MSVATEGDFIPKKQEVISQPPGRLKKGNGKLRLCKDIVE